MCLNIRYNKRVTLQLSAVLHEAIFPDTCGCVHSAATGRPGRAAAAEEDERQEEQAAKKLPYKAKVPGVDPTMGDNVDGDDLVIRRAAVAALGTFAGSVVVVDPSNGRILTMVNQKLALKTGFVPCSTIKLVTALAALTEGLVSKIPASSPAATSDSI